MLTLKAQDFQQPEENPAKLTGIYYAFTVGKLKPKDTDEKWRELIKLAHESHPLLHRALWRHQTDFLPRYLPLRCAGGCGNT